MRAGRVDEGLAAYEVAGQLAERAGAAARARVEANWARALVRVGHFTEAARLAVSAHDAALASGDIVCEGQAHHVLGLIAAAGGDPNRARDEFLEAARIGADAGDMAAVAGPLTHLWRTLMEDGRGGAMADLLLGLIASDAASGTGRQLLVAIAAAVLDQLGRPDEALELLGKDAGRAASGLAGVIDAVVRGAIEVDCGDHAPARARLEAARPLARRTGDGRLNGLLYRSLVDLATWEGRLDDTGPLVDEGMAVLAYTGEPEMAARLSASGLRALADRAERDRRAGRRLAKSVVAAAEALYDQLLALNDETAWRSPPPITEVGASLRTGRAEMTRLRGESAPSEWRAAADAWDVLGISYNVALCRFRLAEAELLSGGERAAEAASIALGDAATTAARLGARPLLAAIEQLARRARLSIDGLGATSERGSTAPHHTSPAPAAPPGKVELTRREREVLAMLEQGATNGEIARTLFISEKTASVHVSHILAKLGVSNRREAAALASRLGISGP
jgi:DNA-binding CsgD family transcriptional regulator/tetratricopeptide (TPR) repeat protein